MDLRIPSINQVNDILLIDLFCLINHHHHHIMKKNANISSLLYTYYYTSTLNKREQFTFFFHLKMQKSYQCKGLPFFLFSFFFFYQSLLCASDNKDYKILFLHFVTVPLKKSVLSVSIS